MICPLGCPSRGVILNASRTYFFCFGCGRGGHVPKHLHRKNRRRKES